MAEEYLIDTNVVIDYLGNRLPSTAASKLEGAPLSILTITRMELLAWRNK
ncbi:hypothetical protein SAMN05192529_11286 [Arachidicoccus rhizosphaerae]|jgi:predicted nucleic acid-binding protein|uniref:PIN domain-containing protein n=1 Tax=Arachidicoccus rhizosphaerae TaxID=551991 RepID=A0A1H3ZX27_9BACT|nr:hypothetical protein SAMN05192529_11286 [Arachidicoccus rhizosphaerae]